MLFFSQIPSFKPLFLTNLLFVIIFTFVLKVKKKNPVIFLFVNFSNFPFFRGFYLFIYLCIYFLSHFVSNTN